MGRIAERRRGPILVSISFASAFALVAGLCLVVNPHWETNDDIGMSMIAHGYGMAAYGSPTILYSSVLWGHLIRFIPSVGDIPGYSLATMGVLVLIAWAMIAFLFRFCVGWTHMFLAALLVLSRPVLVPQFTLNAGLLAVVGVLGLLLYERKRDAGILAVSVLLFFLAYLVRREEFLLVLFVAVPFLPWRLALIDRLALAAGAALVVALAGATWLDHIAYAGPEWTDFHRLNPVRALFTDFGVSEVVKQSPSLLERHGFSPNDIDMIRSWFFADQQLADAERLRALIVDAGSSSTWFFRPTLGPPALLGLVDMKLLPLTIVVAVLCLLQPSWKVFGAIAIMVLALFLIGSFGRGGVLRISYPLLALLFLVQLRNLPSKPIRRLLGGVVACGVIWNGFQLWHETSLWEAPSRELHAALEAIPDQPVVTWGAGFPYERVFPVFPEEPDFRTVSMYALGATTVVPFSRARTEEQAGRGFVLRLLSPEGVPIIAFDRNVELLAIYCGEKHRGRLNEIWSVEVDSIKIRRLYCNTTGAGSASD